MAFPSTSDPSSSPTIIVVDVKDVTTPSLVAASVGPSILAFWDTSLVVVDLGSSMGPSGTSFSLLQGDVSLIGICGDASLDVANMSSFLVVFEVATIIASDGGDSGIACRDASLIAVGVGPGLSVTGNLYPVNGDLFLSLSQIGEFMGAEHEELGMDSSPQSEDNNNMITCSGPMLERNSHKPQQGHHAIKCPRCESTHTKFCYYNNYSLSQPRYFCKTCRRYWTKGGSLRNIPVGGGCRKNKRVSVKKSTTTTMETNPPYDLQFSFPDAHLSHFTSLLGHPENYHNENASFMESNITLGNPRQHDFMGNNDLGLGLSNSTSTNYNGLFSQYGISFNGASMLPFDGSTTDKEDPNVVEVKPNTRFLTHDQWEDSPQGCSEMDGIGLWNYNLTNGYGSSTNSPLV
ncbi:hypothetical protein GIB67_019991 [Kingdonia uniflora]|uniref:Dof zinc finger protein n=1 Tax=Kingdonia uniflora TaxID=39325 RepID=A0A7J7MKL7_9MAGN|nr:hypothetical protein GIB67_019991 [Kingdonia uniflora]